MGISRLLGPVVLTIVCLIVLMTYRGHSGEEKMEKQSTPRLPVEVSTINPFYAWAEKYKKTKDFGEVFKWNHYFDIYHRHFANLRNKKVNILEIGVRDGGSMKMWRDYFGPDAHIYGIDINPKAKRFENKLEGVKIIIGDQENAGFWTKTLKTLPKLDLVIDDGGHTMNQLRVTFDHLYNHVKQDGGIYLVEDLHTSYWPAFQGGYKRSGTFIEYTKDLIDQLNADHSKDKNFKVTNFTRSTQSIHVYDSIVVFEKSPHPKYHTITIK